MEDQKQSLASESAYIMDAEKAAEMHRVQQQGQMVTHAMGGLLPEIENLTSIKNVLDLGCGPGDWAIDLAYANPHMEVLGVDVSPTMLAYANLRKTSQNVSFRQMNILEPLELPDESFDMINARLLFASLPKVAWPGFLHECLRLLRPGGTIRLTEPEWPISNMPASAHFGALAVKALHLSGHTFSPDGRHIGITPMLGGLLKQAGFQQIQQRAFAIDGSANSTYGKDLYENSSAVFLLLQPFLIKMGVATEEELVNLYKETINEMKQPSSYVIWFFLTAWATKPEK